MSDDVVKQVRPQVMPQQYQVYVRISGNTMKRIRQQEAENADLDETLPLPTDMVFFQLWPIEDDGLSANDEASGRDCGAGKVDDPSDPQPPIPDPQTE